MIKGCPKFHEGGNLDDKFCWLCGGELVMLETPRCQCGQHLRNDDKFCVACGKSKTLILAEIQRQKDSRMPPKPKEVREELQ